MIFLSGVFIPVSSLPEALRPVAYAMPLTYGIDSLRASFGYQPEIMHPAASLSVLLLFTVVFLALSVKIMKGRMS
jgi:ABC-2 type transport system permease protein